MKPSIDMCVKLHKMFVTKNTPFEISRISEALIEYLISGITVTDNATNNSNHIFKKEYFEDLLETNISVRKMVAKYLSVIDEQLPRLEGAINCCKKEEARLKLEEEQKKQDKVNKEVE